MLIFELLGVGGEYLLNSIEIVITFLTHKS